MRNQQWEELEAMWVLCLKTWGFWLATIIVSAALGSAWEPLRALVLVGFAAIAYFFVRLVAFMWRWRGDGRHVHARPS